jgi:hypothetical protein
VAAVLAIAIVVSQKEPSTPPEPPRSVAKVSVPEKPMDLPSVASEKASISDHSGSVPPQVAATQVSRSPIHYIAPASQPSTPSITSAAPVTPGAQVAPRGVTSAPAGSSAAPTAIANQISTADESVVEIAVPRGMVLPATFSDLDTPRSPAQAAALDSIADEFLETAFPAAGTPANESGNTAEASNPGTSSEAPTPLPANDAQNAGPTITAEDLQNAGGDPADALQLANERYRQLFGHEAFNNWSTRAAIEALSE